MANILETAAMDGIVTAAAIAAIINALSYIRPFHRFMTGSHANGDLLGAGICVRAVGTICVAVAIVGHHRFGWHTFWLYMLGWALTIVAYHMHYVAWRAAQFGRDEARGWAVAGLFVALAVIAFAVFDYLPVAAAVRI